MINPFHPHEYVYAGTHREFPGWTLWRCVICNKFFYHDNLSNTYTRVKNVDWQIWLANIPYENQN